jgi:hypothetical protein
VLFFFKKEPKTVALRGYNPLMGVVLFKKRTKNSSSARLQPVDGRCSFLKKEPKTDAVNYIVKC